MYNSLDNPSSLKLFIDEHCSYLLNPLEGNTGIPTKYAHSKYLSTLSDCLSLEESYNPQQFSNLPGSTGIYAFFIEGAEWVTQSGTSIRFNGRMFNHYLDSSKGQFIFKDVPISEYKWVPIKYSDNYASLYNMSNKITPEEEYILTSFTQQEVRSLEQAYSTYSQPTKYKGIHINTWHNNWTLGTQGTGNMSKRVTWITEDGESYTRSSIKAAARELGFDSEHVKNTAKVEGDTLLTEIYGKVVVHVEGMSKSTVPLDRRYGTAPNTIVDYSVLEPNKYYLYDSDINQLPYGPFTSARETNEAMGLSSK